MTKPHRARKRFGQNFLVDPNIIFDIVQSITPNRGDAMVEIGPGLGAMTKPVLAQTKALTVIELDRDLIDHLSSIDGLTIIHSDVLKVDFSALSEQFGEKLRVIGNLPYNISTPIIFHLLNQLESIEDMHFMLQKEVIERMGAEPNNREYGRLSVMVQRYCEVIPLLEIPPEAFDPAPKVTSQFVRLIPFKESPYRVVDESLFEQVVQAAFAMKRKMIRNNLKEYLTEEELEACGIKPMLRPENLTVADYVTLANFIAERRGE